MSIQGLGYVVVGAPDPAAWLSYAVEVIGLMPVEPVGDSPVGYLRMDEQPYRIKVETAERGSFTCIGWEVSNAAALRRLVADIRGRGITVVDGTDEERDERRVEELVHLDGPAGVRTELFVGRRLAESAFVSPLGVSFVTGDQGLGHTVFKTADAQGSVEFYQDVLGFRLSDVAQMPDGTFYFLGCNPRHHSIAFVKSRRYDGAHHLLFEMTDPNQVGRALDRVQARRIPLLATLGKHANDSMFSFYMRSPAGFGVEVGAEGRRVDESWVSRTYTADIWGHRAVPVGDLGY